MKRLWTKYRYSTGPAHTKVNVFIALLEDYLDPFQYTFTKTGELTYGTVNWNTFMEQVQAQGKFFIFIDDTPYTARIF